MKKAEKFPCSQCGECCRHINLVPQLTQFDRGDGICIHLRQNICGIYENRPEICRVDAMYEKYYHHLYSREEFYQLNLEGCQKLQNEKHQT